jgi:hypothetical protein
MQVYYIHDMHILIGLGTRCLYACPYSCKLILIQDRVQVQGTGTGYKSKHACMPSGTLRVRCDAMHQHRNNHGYIYIY